MYSLVLSILMAVSVLLILVVLMQPTKTNAASSLSGGAEELFVRRKSRGFEAFLQRVTFILLIIFFVLAVVLMYLTNKGL